MQERSCNHCCSGKTISVTCSECVCSLRYPACIAHAPHCYLWPARLYNILPPCHTNGSIFGGEKKLLNLKCVFSFSIRLFFETFLFPRRNEHDMIKKVCIGLHVKHPLFLSYFNETWIFLADFRKYSNIKFHENPSSGSPFVSCGLTDGQTWQS
jgi:hypothetical protein